MGDRAALIEKQGKQCKISIKRPVIGNKQTTGSAAVQRELMRIKDNVGCKNTQKSNTCSVRHRV